MVNMPEYFQISKWWFLISVISWQIFRVARRVQRSWLRLSIRATASAFLAGSLAISFFLSVVLVGCSKTLITSHAPNRSATVRVNETCFFPDCSVDVTSQTHWWTEQRIASRRDCIVNFAHVAWSSDSRVAAVFVDNGDCSSIHVGYDFRTRSVVPFEPLADLVRRSIVKEYSIRPEDLRPYGGDPLEWAHYAGDGKVKPGVEAFRKKYGPDRWP